MTRCLYQACVSPVMNILACPGMTIRTGCLTTGGAISSGARGIEQCWVCREVVNGADSSQLSVALVLVVVMTMMIMMTMEGWLIK